MSDQFPRMLYQTGGTEEIHGGRFATRIVGDQAELDAAIAEGWHLTTDAAKDAAKPVLEHERGEEAPEDNAPPTRAELEAKARELKITFDGRTTDAKLAAKIAAALKA